MNKNILCPLGCVSGPTLRAHAGNLNLYKNIYNGKSAIYKDKALTWFTFWSHHEARLLAQSI